MDDVQRGPLARSQAPDDVGAELTLRPRRLAQYFGQEAVKESLRISIAAARGREDPLDHILIHGPPGLGKTTLAMILAAEMGVSIRITAGPAIERTGDLASVLTTLQSGDILFIDEVHRLPRVVEETLYPAMEDFSLDIILGSGPQARDVRLKLNRFTLIGATTRYSLVSQPLRDRFGATYRLDFYSDDELDAIVRRSAELLHVEVEPAAARAIARRGRGTPRIVNRLLKRVRDHAEVHGDGRVDERTATEAMRQMEIDDEGLDSTDRKLLAAIVQKFGSGPVGVQALAAVLAEESETIEDVYEPFLLRLGFIDRTPQGRIATEGARQHLSKLGFEVPPPRRGEPDMVGLWETPGGDPGPTPA